MTLRVKTLIIIGAMLAGSLGALYIVSRIVLLGSFAKLEEQETRRNVDRVRSALADELSTLDHLCRDSATWDKAYAFIENGDPDFIRSDVGYGRFSTLSQRGQTLLLYIHSSGRIVFGEGFDLRTQKETPIPEGLHAHLLPGGTLLRHSTPESGVAGILLIPEGPILLASRPIVTTDGQGPIRGSLLVGRSLDSTEIARLSEKTHLAVALLPFQDPRLRSLFPIVPSAQINNGPVAVQPVNGDTIAGYALLGDMNGNPALVLRVTMPREVYHRGQTSVIYFSIVILAGGLVASILTLLLLEKAILSRVAILSSSVLTVGETGDLSRRVQLTGTDELGHLAGAVNRMLEALEASRRLERESEERYRLLFQRNQAGVFRCTTDGKIIDGNEALARILGHTSREEMLAPHQAEAQWGGEDTASFLTRLKEQSIVSNWEGILRRRDGSPVWVLASGTLLDGCVIEGTVIDITDRKQAEAENLRLVTAIEQSAEAVVITNPTGEIEYVNAAFTWITGYKREEVMGQSTKILKSGKHDRAFYQQLWETILKGRNWHGELINRRKDGTLYTELMAISAVKGERGEVTHFIATKQDVTERKSLEAQLQQAAKIDAVGGLAAGVAHDFNNLLTIINGYTELLVDQFASNEEVSAFLKEIKDAGERAASLTHQLLAFSRHQVLAPEVIDLNSVISNLEKMLKRLIGEDITLHTHLDPSLGLVKADPGQIEQVIMNLAVNSRDAMPTGGNFSIETSNVELDEVFARSHLTMEPGSYVLVAVGDTGVGMTPETKAHIFEPFFTTKGKGKGTGLGLATVYGIIKQSGGSIWVYSEPGQGTVFKLYLPVASGEPIVKRDAITSADSASGSETILVVEDEEGVRSMVRLALASAGYKVLESADGESALLICADHGEPIHLLITDVVMPKMSGPLVADKVATLRPGIKVLYMSGYTDDAVVHYGVLRQEMPFIQKPFSPIALRKKVREVLGEQKV